MEDWKLVGKPGLLVLDMQHDIVGFGGKEESSGFPRACQESGIIPRIQALIKVFREKKLPVIYVVAEFNPLIKSPAYGLFNERMRTARPNAPNSPGCQIIPELAPDGNEPVVRKWNVGPFSNSNLHEVLKHYGVETLVMAGVATNIVVYTGTLQATDLGYSVIVLKDAVTTNDKEAHEYCLNKALPLFSLVTTSQELLSRL